MINKIKFWQTKTSEMIKMLIPLFIPVFLCAIFVYMLLMNEGLVNSDDGLWEYNYYKAGKWSLQIGRWAWLYLDRIKLGIAPEPLSTVFSLAGYSFGIALIVWLLGEAKQRRKGLFMALPVFLSAVLVVANVSVCISLSYRFMSPTFSLAFVLSILSAVLILKVKNKYVSVLFGAALLCVCMGLYQAYISCTCVVLLTYILCRLLKTDCNLRELAEIIVRSVLTAIIGAIAYILILDLHLKIFHLQMVDYNGANTYSIWNSLSNLGFSLKNTYIVFKRFFFDNYFKVNALQNYFVLWLAFLIVGGCLLYKAVILWKRNKVYSILAVLSVFLYPLASNAILLVAISAWVSLQMTVAMAMVLPMLFLLLLSLPCETKMDKLIKPVVAAVLAVVLYGSYLQVQIDLESMRSGEAATRQIAEQILDQVCFAELYEEDNIYLIYGNPSRNSLYHYNKIMSEANSYALFGNWPTNDYQCMRRSWQGTFSYLCGVDLQMGSATEHFEMMKKLDFETMPYFPMSGSVKKIDNYIIIKISD